VIYCVVPEALAAELFDKLTAYYEDDPNVTVIIERRKGSRRTQATAPAPTAPAAPAEARSTPDGSGSMPDEPGSMPDESRSVRDRRRPRVVGELPEVPPGG
jgi:hypothetical protein